MDISLCGYEYCDANFVVIHRCLDIDIVMLHQLQKSSQNLYWFPMGQTNPRHLVSASELTKQDTCLYVIRLCTSELFLLQHKDSM